jgi:purine catabolism regulator
VLNGGGLREIVHTLSDLVNRPAAIVDSDGQLLASSPQFPPTRSGARLLPATQPGAGLGFSGLDFDGGACSVAVQPVRAGADDLAAMLVLADPGELTDEDQMALDRAAIVTALRLVQERMAAEADRRFQAVCLDELVTGHLSDRAVLRERALAFGWNLSLPRGVLVAELESLDRRAFADLAGTPEESWAAARLADAARVALGREAIVWERSAGVAALVVAEAPERDPLRAPAARLQATAQRRLNGAELSVGIGRVYDDPLQLADSYTEAVRALRTARRASGPGQIASFAQLGLERLLLSCSETELRAYVETTLGPLHAYERSHPGANLTDTLRAFLAHNRTIAGTARALYVHYNTVRYRLERLEDLIGPFLDDPEQCLRLELALRVSRLLSRPGS